MSLVNEKEYNINDYKPKELDKIITEAHANFAKTTKLFRHSCPACASQEYDFAFEKFGFHYVQCIACMSLYVQDGLDYSEKSTYETYLDSELYSTQFYADYVANLAETNSFELELTFSRLLNKTDTFNIGYFGTKKKLFVKAFQAFNAKITDLKSSKIENNEKFDLIILDHDIEKPIDLFDYLNNMESLLNSNGLIFAMIRVGSGIDILTLWDESKLFPIEHNNLLSIDGLKIAFDRSALHIKEINTPGVLDVENIITTNSDNIPKFLQYLIKTDKKRAIEEFQSFIQKNLLSSYCTIIATKAK
jgi:hypothetical protein